MTRLICLLAFLAACGVPLSAEGLTADELSRLDVRGTASSIGMIEQATRALSPQSRADAAESLRILSVNDPYTRAALQVPFAMHKAVMDVDPLRLDPFIRTDWEALQHGLTTHVAVLTALDVDLAEPMPGDLLYGQAQGLMLDRHTLVSSDDPVAMTAQLMDQVVALGQRADETTLALIHHHSERVEAATGIGRTCPRGPHHVQPGQPWTLGMQLGGWHDALRRLAPFVHEPELSAQIGAMLEIFEAYDTVNQTYSI